MVMVLIVVIVMVVLVVIDGIDGKRGSDGSEGWEVPGQARAALVPNLYKLEYNSRRLALHEVSAWV